MQRKTDVVEAALTRAARKAPIRGEVWWVNLDPTKGHEQAGKRPVVVLTPERFNRATDRAIVVPMTTKLATPGTQRAKLQVPITSMDEPSVALPDQIETIDWAARYAAYSGKDATDDELDEIKARVDALIG
ncbi:type II toxin-antitoxin system PemK/MazF family toxin [Cupriavidus plantarum]|uniref:type II toxin-antitoxin system PemK/MazF family toxin n=1 Tax=Cupriavidus plantarum TaxID=942865 RepID=UPI001BAA3500|nr:type II toxin-antitoxin system PemK/MazF family toxin [Cupriavidus plantarum]